MWIHLQIKRTCKYFHYNYDIHIAVCCVLYADIKASGSMPNTALLTNVILRAPEIAIDTFFTSMCSSVIWDMQCSILLPFWYKTKAMSNLWSLGQILVIVCLDECFICPFSVFAESKCMTVTPEIEVVKIVCL